MNLGENNRNLHIDTRVEEGRPAKIIVQVAEEDGFDLRARKLKFYHFYYF
jgi:hypothetical protein